MKYDPALLETTKQETIRRIH